VGFYLRKRFNVGPVRLNLSKSGLGVSVGIPGLRIGKGPRGAYVHAGRQGFYYRQGLPAHIQHHHELTPQDMSRASGQPASQHSGSSSVLVHWGRTTP
jgi:hypothetical protein